MKKRMISTLAVTLAMTLLGPGLATATATTGSSTSQKVPLRVLSDQLGATLKWDANTSTATMTEGGKSLQVQIGSSKAQVNGQALQLPEAIALQQDRTYVPLQLVSDLLGKPLTWDEEAGRLAIGLPRAFTTQGLANGSKASYDLALRMSEDHQFTVTATVQVINVSEAEWDHAIFYFIPNAFTEEFKDTDNVPKYLDEEGNPLLDEDGNPLIDHIEYGTVKIDSLKVNGTEAAFKLNYDTLDVPLATKLKPGEKAEIQVAYHFTLPEPGTRFTKVDQFLTYSLAQWYPMLATYTNNGWNKEDYSPYSESYHTGFSDFTLSYDLPVGYSLISSSDEDLPLSTNKGQISAKNVKELYAQVSGYEDLTMVTQEVDGVEVRVFGPASEWDALEKTLEFSGKALHFYNANIGAYPHKQLDIMTNDGGMEYPGIVTVPLGLYGMNPTSYEETVAHEIAHQWFYGTVSSDPYHEGWLDEGITELCTSLYMYGVEKVPETSAFRGYRFGADRSPAIISNQSIVQLRRNVLFKALYAQPAERMWNLFKRNSGTQDPLETGLHFLRNYYYTYQYQQVTTPEFVRFATTYFPTDESFYATWLKWD